VSHQRRPEECESEILQIFPDLRVLGPRVMGPKRPNLSLDLNATGGKRKQAAQNAGILNSPDVNKLKLTSPQIKLLIEQGHTGVTPTISAAAGSNTAQTGYVFPPTAATVNQVQHEVLVKQFAERSKEKDLAQQSLPAAISTSRAAKQMSGGALLLPSTIAETVSHQHKGGQETSSSGPPSNASSADSFKLEIKQEPFEEGSSQLAESSSTKGRGKGTKGKKVTGVGVGAEFAPIDMGSQEEQKLERKRSRNRVAATKCRKKKLEKISKLEERVKVLKSENTDLGQILKQLKDNVCNLKQEIMSHVQQGCDIKMGGADNQTIQQQS